MPLLKQKFLIEEHEKRGKLLSRNIKDLLERLTKAIEDGEGKESAIRVLGPSI